MARHEAVQDVWQGATSDLLYPQPSQILSGKLITLLMARMVRGYGLTRLLHLEGGMEAEQFSRVQISPDNGLTWEDLGTWRTHL